MTKLNYLLGFWLGLRHRTSHDERGLSQSTENALLLAGAALIAVSIVAVITAFVNDELAKLP